MQGYSGRELRPYQAGVGRLKLLDRLGQSEYMVLLTEHDLVIREALIRWKGPEVKHTGDGSWSCSKDVDKVWGGRSMSGTRSRCVPTRMSASVSSPPVSQSTTTTSLRLCGDPGQPDLRGGGTATDP